MASEFIGGALTALARVHAIGDRSLYNLQLDQWSGPTDGSLEDLRNKIDGTKFAAGEDNLGFDLSLQGCRNANLAFAQMGNKTSTYYLSLVRARRANRAYLAFHSRR